MNQQISIFTGQRQTRGIAQQARSGLAAPSHPRISIRGGAFTLIDAGGDEYPAPVVMHPTKRVAMLMCIIVGANGNKSKVYYPETWSPDSAVPPLCFSDNGIAPSIGAQEAQATTCAECWFNKWGSATSKITGKDTKACSDKKKVAVMVIGDSTGLTYELQIPPASLGAIGDYSDKIMSMNLPGGERDTDLHDVVTAITFTPGKTGYLEFDYLAWVDSVGIGPDGMTYLNYDQNGVLTAPDGGWGIVQRIDAVWDSGVIDVLCGLRDQPWRLPPGANAAALPGMRGQPSALPLPDRPVTAHNPALSAGYAPQPHPSGPYAPPPGTQPSIPTQAFRPPANPAGGPPAPSLPSPSAPQASTRGGARQGAGRKAGGKNAAKEPEQNNVVSLQQGHTAQDQENPIPPFLQRGPANTAAPAASANPGGNGGAHGMSNAPPPPPGLMDALTQAMKLKGPQ